MGHTACTEPQCLYNGALYLYLYLYFPIRAVRPVQILIACTRVHFTFTYTSTPPMDLQPVQSLSACTRVHLYLYLYLYSPYGPYCLHRASVPVQRCTLPLPIPLFPLWAILPVQSLSACTTVYFTFTYTSTPPYGPYDLYRSSLLVQVCTLPLPILLLPHKGCTACTEPQCLYKCALYLYLYLYSPYGPTACTESQCLYKGAPLPLPYPYIRSVYNMKCNVRWVKVLSCGLGKLNVQTKE